MKTDTGEKYRDQMEDRCKKPHECPRSQRCPLPDVPGF